MKAKSMIKGLVVAFIAAIGIGTFVFLRKKLSKDNSKQEESTDTVTDDATRLDRVYETLLEPDTEVSAPSDEKTKNVVVKLIDRSFWSVYGSLIISSFIIVAFALCTVAVSIATQNAYSDRKEMEENRNATEQAAKIKEQEDYEKLQTHGLTDRLDSIDVHIKALKPVPKPVVKKKKSK